jgi:hypothetical protein
MKLRNNKTHNEPTDSLCDWSDDVYYKAFDLDLKCRGYQYEVGKVYTITGKLMICFNGFHCCKHLLDCLTYYPNTKTTRYCEVLVCNNSITKDDKTVTSQIKIVKEICQTDIFNGCLETFNGAKHWYKDGKRHRDAQSAEQSDGDLPASVYSNGDKSWYKDGKLHRDGDLPAYVCSDGKYWYKDGKLHRDGDLPAYVTSDGGKSWYKDGKQHRDGDLPAYVSYNGGKYWYKDNKLHRDGDLPSVVTCYGVKYWYKDNKLHRDGDLPAVVSSNGVKKWYKDGKLHRDGDKWYKDGKLHRDGVKKW